MTAPPDLAALFERARSADIGQVAGVALFRSRRRLRGECPLCGASKGMRASGAFSVEPDARVFKCFACGEGGDVVRLEQLLRGGAPREAAERLVGAAPLQVDRPPPMRPSPAPAALVDPATERAARRIWAEALPARGSLVQAYLASRGITGPVAMAALERLRFHPHVWWGEEADGTRIWLPAMVAQLRAPEGPTGGVHVTFLDAAGAKTRREGAKRMLGPQSLDGARGGVWLAGPASFGPLIVGEGIESTLSAAILLGGPCRIVATLSLGALQGVWTPDRWGRMDPACVSLDPNRPPFTWPEPEGARWGEVVIAVDRDMKPVRVKARRATGGTYQRVIEAEERAQVCAALAQQAWRRAGAHAVRVIAPGPGRDFNDELLARLKRRAA